MLVSTKTQGILSNRDSLNLPPWTSVPLPDPSILHLLAEVYLWSSKSMRPNIILNSSSIKDTTSSGVISNWDLKLCRSNWILFHPNYQGTESQTPKQEQLQKRWSWQCRGNRELLSTCLLFNHCNLTCLVSPNDRRSVCKFYIQASSLLSGLFLSHLFSCHLYSWQDVQFWQSVACQHQKRTPLLK